MSKTRAQLIRRALQRIGVLAAGQSMSAEDEALVDEQIDPMAAELSGRLVVTIADTASFDDAYFQALADCLGFTVAADFGVNSAELVLLGVDGKPGGAAEQRLKLMQATQPLPEPVITEYI